MGHGNALIKNFHGDFWVKKSMSAFPTSFYIVIFQHYIEAFYELCKEIGGETEEAMCPLLEFEADRRCFLITINSFNTELTKDVREKLYPTCGKLYPEGLAMLNASEDFEQV